jgi:hypothetical protein
MANSWPVSTAPGDLYQAIEVPGYNGDIDVVTWPEVAGGVHYYALLTTGTVGIAVVAMKYISIPTFRYTFPPPL